MVQLTESQNKALEELNDYTHSESLLIGSAGTGKSFLLAYWLESNFMHSRAILIAPTNKAKKVLHDFCLKNNLRTRVTTIANFLEYRPHYNPHGEQYFGLIRTNIKQVTPVTCLIKGKPQQFRKLGINPKVIVVDEASMVANGEYRTLKRVAKELKIRIIWVGDDYQLPPIGSEISPVFKKVNHKIYLTEQCRNNSDILTVCNSVRTDIDNLTVYPNLTGAKRIGNIWLDRAIRKIKEDNEVRLITYTNNRVAGLNKRVREGLFGDKAEEYDYIEGEPIIFNKPYLTQLEEMKYCRPDFYDASERRPEDFVVAVNNNVECQIRKVDTVYCFHPFSESVTDFLKEIDFNPRLPDFFWLILTVDLDAPDIWVISSEHKERYKDFWGNVRDKMKSQIKGKTNRQKESFWWEYNNLRQCNANIAHAHAITANKSQGSSYQIVFADNRDIMRLRNKEALKRLYVACSRAKEELYLK